MNPKIGLHTRLTDEPNPDNIMREFTMLRDMGGTWATEFFPWNYIQPNDKFRFDWDHADKVADAAASAGVTILARLDGVPDWARPADTTWRYLDRAHYADYGDFVFAFVSHFKGRISQYIIWNEPNTAAEWGQRPPDPAAYADLLKVAITVPRLIPDSTHNEPPARISNSPPRKGTWKATSIVPRATSIIMQL